MYSDSDLLKEAEARVRRALERPSVGQAEYGYIVSKIRDVLGHYVYQQTRLRPLITPVVTEV